MPSFNGKVAIVTGGGSGYGRGIAEKLRRGGAEVLIADVSESVGAQAASELDAIFVKADVTARADWEVVLATALDKYGKIDIVVNNAGACYLKKPTENVTEREYEAMMDVNVKGLYHSVSVIIPHLLQRNQEAVFVNIASTSGIRPRPGLTWYNASKAAVIASTNSMAVEYAPNKIRFNVVSPVFGLTSMTGILDETQQKAMAAAIPLGRTCTPQDVANAVAYLASDDADFITGVNLQVDGGRCV